MIGALGAAALVLACGSAQAQGTPGSARLVVEGDVVGQVMIFDGDELVMELTREGGAPTEVGLSPDVYRVTVRNGARWWQAEVSLSAGKPSCLSAAGLRPMGVAEPWNWDFDVDWDFGILLSSGTAVSPVPAYDDLLISHLGLELRVEQVVLQWRFRYGHDLTTDMGGMEGEPPLFQEVLLGTDLGLLGSWGWEWLALRVGLRGGVDFQAQEQGEPDGVSVPAQNEELWLVVRGGVVGQVVLRPLDWLGLFAEVSTDIYLDGTLVEGAQGGVTFYVD